MFRKFFRISMIAMATAFAFACTNKGDVTTPQGVLRDYVSKAFAMKVNSDVDGLLQLSTGAAKTELERLRADEELFQKSFVEERNTSDGTIKIRDERKVSDDRYAITYELSYKSQSKDAGDNKVTTKKQAILTKESSGWKIAEVQNIKTFVEHSTDVNISVSSKR